MYNYWRECMKVFHRTSNVDAYLKAFLLRQLHLVNVQYLKQRRLAQLHHEEQTGFGACSDQFYYVRVFEPTHDHQLIEEVPPDLLVHPPRIEEGLHGHVLSPKPAPVDDAHPAASDDLSDLEVLEVDVGPAWPVAVVLVLPRHFLVRSAEMAG